MRARRWWRRWWRRWSRPLSRCLAGAIAVVALVGVIVAVAPVVPHDRLTDPTCFRPGNLPEILPDPPVLPGLPSDTAGADESTEALLRQANAAARAGQLDIAEILYQQVLEKPDARGAQGLAHVRARQEAAERVAASAQRMAAADDRGADACFQTALLLDPENEDARRGLTLDTRSLFSRASDRWDAFVARWLAPLGQVALPLLIALLVLLVLSRLVTPLVAPPDARAWPAWIRRLAWWSGLVLLLVAAARVLARLGGPAAPLDGLEPTRRTGVVAALAVLLVLLVLAARGASWLASRRDGLLHPRRTAGAALVANWGLGLGLGWAAAAVALLCAAVATRLAAGTGWALPDQVWPWLLSIEIVLVGLVLHAIGRGHALRLHVQVRQGGTNDPAGAAYLLDRLKDLGTSPPRGLKAPQLVDVTDLPETALSSLPAGKVAAAVTSALNALRPPDPWRATVEDFAGDRLTVTLTRNGQVAGSEVILGGRFRTTATPDAGDGDRPAEEAADRGDLLTAAAAIVLTELSGRHRELRVGLCGATRWESVAAYVVASGRQGTIDAEVRRKLLARAVELDPPNALARTARLLQRGESATEQDPLAAHARRLDELWEQVLEQSAAEAPFGDQGYAPLLLRLAHARTAAWLNLCLVKFARGRGWGFDWDFARTAYHDLVDLLDISYDRGDAQLRDFLCHLCLIAAALRDGLKALCPGARLRLPTVPAPEQDFSLSVLYDEACTAAVQGYAHPHRRSVALEKLEQAADDPQLREWARVDPAFIRLRESGWDDDDCLSRYWDIVAADDPTFTSLAPFGDKGPAVKALGLDTPTALFAATDGAPARRNLARTLSVPTAVVGAWRALCVLAAPDMGRPGWLDARELRVLLALDLRTPGQLHGRAGDQELRRKIVTKAVELGLRPPTPGQLTEILYGA